MRAPDAARAGVSFVVPVHNGEVWLERMLSAIGSQADGRPMEIIVVEDRSRDGSRRILERQVRAGKIRLVDGEGRGAAAALNVGVRHARYPIVCQVDQDVILHPGWLAELTRQLEESDVAAA